MLTLLRNGFIQRSRGFVKFQIRTCSRFENFTNPLVVRSPRSGGTRSGCNPRERCGERSGADFATTGNGFAKAGLLHLKFLLKLHQAKTIFVFSKLQKNKKRNGFLRLIMTKLSTQEKFTPAFAKPMLCAVFSVRRLNSTC